MHFWINKSQGGRGLNGRYLPSSISAGSRRNLVCGGLYPKPMVTPVHRFQSIESVASGGHRHSRAPHYHTRFPAPPSPQHPNSNAVIAECGGSTSVQRQSHGNRQQMAPLEYVSAGEHSSMTPAHRTVQISRLKCGVWAVIGLIPFFIAAAKYYFSGEHMGVEALAFCSVLIFILLVGGFMSMMEVYAPKRMRRRPSVQISSEQNETFENSSQVPPSVTPIHAELPPPPYHVAVMLPTQSEHLMVIQDSPPPTYEKAVT